MGEDAVTNDAEVSLGPRQHGVDKRGGDRGLVNEPIPDNDRADQNVIKKGGTRRIST